MGRGIRNLFSRRTDDTLKKILGNEGDSSQPSDRVQAQSDGDEAIIIPIDQIVASPFQPRRIFKEDHLKTLADSIKTRGVLQPIVVRRVSVSPPKYEVIAGERRLRSAKIARLSSIPAVLKKVADSEMRVIALSENLQREDLKVTEKTRAIGELFNDLKSVDMVAVELGLSLRIVERYMRIYRVIYASSDLASVFERQADLIDFKTAETMASLFETIMNSHESREKFFEIVNSEGIKSAIKYFFQLIEEKTSRRVGKSFSIVIRKDKLIFTVRHDRNTKITTEDKREIQQGLEQFFLKLSENAK